MTGSELPGPRQGVAFEVQGRQMARHQHALLVAAMLVVGAFLHYAHLVPGLESVADGSAVGDSARSMERILFLVPVAYAGFVLGAMAGNIALAVALATMLPQAFIFEPQQSTALFQIVAVALIGAFVFLWARLQQAERVHRQEVLARLESARQELISHVDIIRKTEQRLVTINQVCAAISQSLDLKTGLEWTLERVCSEMGAESALLFLVDEETHELSLVAHRGVSEALARSVARLKPGEGLSGRVVATGEPLVVENGDTEHQAAWPEVALEGLRSQLIVPLKTRERTIGTLCVATRQQRRFTRDEAELLTALGNQVGFSVENARLYHRVRASERKYRDLFENATVPIFLHDLKGFITDANRAFTILTGYDKEGLVVLHVSSLLPPDALDKLGEIERKLVAGEPEPAPLEVALRHRDGSQRIVSMPVRLIIEDGQPVGFEHIAIDVTDRHKMQQSLSYYLRQVLTAQEDERMRISQELHDDTAQSLLLISHRLDSLSSDPSSALPEETRVDLQGVRQLVIQTLGDLRRLTQDLRPRILDDLGLIPALEWLADDLQKDRRVTARVEVKGGPRRLPAEVELLLFRIAQEAVRNVRKHSEATHTTLSLEFRERAVAMAVQDNGKGFQLPQNLADMADRGKLGLVGMQERARLLGGALSVQSAPGKGTIVSVELPV